jgi:hypothetical protein
MVITHVLQHNVISETLLPSFVKININISYCEVGEWIYFISLKLKENLCFKRYTNQQIKGTVHKYVKSTTMYFVSDTASQPVICFGPIISPKPFAVVFSF